MDFKPVCVWDFQEYAGKHLSQGAFNYFKSGANDEITLKDNYDSFKRWRIRPRVLRDVSQIDLTTSILGNKIAFPVCVSPTALHGLAHPDAEVATATGVLTAGVGYTQGIQSSKTIEEVYARVPNVLRFLQMYILADRDLTLQMRCHVRRAEANGCKALVITLDSPVWGRRVVSDKDNFFQQPLPDFTYANFLTPETSNDNATGVRNNRHRVVLKSRRNTSADLKWLVAATRLPVIVKGILTGEDAKLAVDCGVSGILVSNHGGRQLDTVLSTIDALPEVVAAVNGRCEVYLDGGVRNGTDIFKALALGAKSVFLGRPVLYALTYKGAEGVTKMLNILKEEFHTTMALTGCSSVEEIKHEMVVHETVYTSRL